LKLLKVLGWIFVPFVMIFVQWKKMNKGLKIVGGIWAGIMLLVFIGNISNKDDKQLVSPKTEVASIKTVITATPIPTIKPTPIPTPVLTEEEKAKIAKDKEAAIKLAADKVIADKKVADDKAIADKKVEDAKARTMLVESQFSLWDGSHAGLKKVVKDAMNDPDSFKHDETTFRDDGNYITVQMKYRGKNAFGGVVRGVVVAKVDFSGNVLEIVSQG
jgi:hypothetical protein